MKNFYYILQRHKKRNLMDVKIFSKVQCWVQTRWEGWKYIKSLKISTRFNWKVTTALVESTGTALSFISHFYDIFCMTFCRVFETQVVTRRRQYKAWSLIEFIITLWCREDYWITFVTQFSFVGSCMRIKMEIMTFCSGWRWGWKLFYTLTRLYEVSICPYFLARISMCFCGNSKFMQMLRFIFYAPRGLLDETIYRESDEVTW
jgi:hypothetical protein